MNILYNYNNEVLKEVYYHLECALQENYVYYDDFFMVESSFKEVIDLLIMIEQDIKTKTGFYSPYTKNKVFYIKQDKIKYYLRKIKLTLIIRS